MYYFPSTCVHCKKPPCLTSCPNNAIYIHPDGVVLINEEKCQGCNNCVKPCPYKAAHFNNKKYRKSKQDFRKAPPTNHLPLATATNCELSHYTIHKTAISFKQILSFLRGLCGTIVFLFSQGRYVRLNVNGNINRASYLLIECVFQIFRYLVGGGYAQIRVNKDMQVEKDFSADRASP